MGLLNEVEYSNDIDVSANVQDITLHGTGESYTVYKTGDTYAILKDNVVYGDNLKSTYLLDQQLQRIDAGRVDGTSLSDRSDVQQSIDDLYVNMYAKEHHGSSSTDYGNYIFQATGKDKYTVTSSTGDVIYQGSDDSLANSIAYDAAMGNNTNTDTYNYLRAANIVERNTTTEGALSDLADAQSVADYKAFHGRTSYDVDGANKYTVKYEGVNQFVAYDNKKNVIGTYSTLDEASSAALSTYNDNQAIAEFKKQYGSTTVYAKGDNLITQNFAVECVGENKYKLTNVVTGQEIETFTDFNLASQTLSDLVSGTASSEATLPYLVKAGVIQSGVAAADNAASTSAAYAANAADTVSFHQMESSTISAVANAANAAATVSFHQLESSTIAARNAMANSTFLDSKEFAALVAPILADSTNVEGGISTCANAVSNFASACQVQATDKTSGDIYSRRQTLINRIASARNQIENLNKAYEELRTFIAVNDNYDNIYNAFSNIDDEARAIFANARGQFTLLNESASAVTTADNSASSFTSGYSGGTSSSSASSSTSTSSGSNSSTSGSTGGSNTSSGNSSTSTSSGSDGSSGGSTGDAASSGVSPSSTTTSSAIGDDGENTYSGVTDTDDVITDDDYVEDDIIDDDDADVPEDDMDEDGFQDSEADEDIIEDDYPEDDSVDDSSTQDTLGDDTSASASVIGGEEDINKGGYTTSILEDEPIEKIGGETTYIPTPEEKGLGTSTSDETIDKIGGDTRYDASVDYGKVFTEGNTQYYIKHDGTIIPFSGTTDDATYTGGYIPGERSYKYTGADGNTYYVDADGNVLLQSSAATSAASAATTTSTSGVINQAQSFSSSNTTTTTPSSSATTTSTSGVINQAQSFSSSNTTTTTPSSSASSTSSTSSASSTSSSSSNTTAAMSEALSNAGIHVIDAGVCSDPNIVATYSGGTITATQLDWIKAVLNYCPTAQFDANITSAQYSIEKATFIYPLNPPTN
jgi:hypothetical protein